MKKIVLTHGIVSGLVLVAISVVLWPLAMNGQLPSPWGEIVGFGAMILAFTAVFFGVRAYRENEGGNLTFGRGLKVGLLIALITCAFYVIGWEIVYWGFIPDFADRYAAIQLAKMQADGASAAEIAKTQAEMVRLRELLANPLINVGIAFMEIFPVGLIVSVISAAILRRKTPNATAAAAA